jgi:UrcA family protein
VIAVSAGMARDETVVARDDLDASPQTQMPLAVSHKRVFKYRLKRRDVMSNFITARVAGSRTKSALLLLAGFVGVMGVGAAGAASPGSDVPSIVVKYSDQSLTTDGGVKELYHRIVKAATKVCPEASIRSLSLQSQVQQCRQEAVARAIRQIDNSRLATLHATNSKNS